MRGFSSLVLGLAALAVVVGSLASVSTARAADPPTATFDWSMPDRLQDTDGDGYIDEYFNGSQAPEILVPESWTVDFDACGSTADGIDIDEFRWTVDGDDAGTVSDCDAFSHSFAEEGVYAVGLTVVDSDGQESSFSQAVTVQDWLIIALGDSYGSGEGNPDSPISTAAYQDYLDAVADLQQANQQLNSALQQLFTAQNNYNSTVAEINDVRNARTALNAAITSRNNLCNPLLHPFVLIPGSDDFDNCAAATALVPTRRIQLLNELTDVGMQALVDSVTLIEEALNDAQNAALAAVNVAQSAVNVAQAAIAAGQSLVATSKGELTPEWRDARCHRSAVAGSAQAALMIEKADPRTSVTFLHLACSGAKIEGGLLSGYDGAESAPGDPTLLPQVLESSVRVDGREVDAMYMSIGGNDANFANIVTSCVVQQTCQFTPSAAQTGLAGIKALHCAAVTAFGQECLEYFEALEENTTTGLEYYETGIALLEPRYSDLSDRISTLHPDLDQGRVYISEYPNAVQNDDGAYCPDSTDPNPLASLPGVSLDETVWADQTVAVTLNAEIAASAATHGWKMVDGIYDGFAGHGYCADDHWLVRLQESFLLQGNESGGVHPGVTGHALYAQQIFASLMEDFYPSGDLSQPRAPLAPEQEPEPEPVSVAEELDHAGSLIGSYDPTPTADAPYGVYTLTGTGINNSSASFTSIVIVATSVSDGAIVLNADGGPGGVGATTTLSGDELGPDGLLTPGEEFTVTALIGLLEPLPFWIEYEVLGIAAP